LSRSRASGLLCSLMRAILSDAPRRRSHRYVSALLFRLVLFVPGLVAFRRDVQRPSGGGLVGVGAHPLLVGAPRTVFGPVVLEAVPPTTVLYVALVDLPSSPPLLVGIDPEAGASSPCFPVSPSMRAPSRGPRSMSTRAKES